MGTATGVLLKSNDCHFSFSNRDGIIISVLSEMNANWRF